MGIIFNVVEQSPDLVMNCLEVTAFRTTRDMSVGNSTRVTGSYPYREVCAMVDKEFTLMDDFPPCCVNSVSVDEAVVNWLQKAYTLPVGEALRPLYSWLSASKNRNTLIISDYSCFVERLGALPAADRPDVDVWLDNFAKIVVRNRLRLTMHWGIKPRDT